MAKQPAMSPRPLDTSSTPGAFDLNSLLRRDAETAADAAPSPSLIPAATTPTEARQSGSARPTARAAVRPAGRPKAGAPGDGRSHTMRLHLPHDLYKTVTNIALDRGTDRQTLLLEALKAWAARQSP